MEQEQKQTSLPLFGIPRLLPFVRPYRGTILLMVALGFLSSLIDAVYPLFNRYALDHYIAEGTMDTLPVFLALYLLILAVQVAANYRSMYDCGKVEMNLDRDLRNRSFNHLQTLSFSYFNRNNVGYIHARIMSDTGKIGESVSWRMMDLVWNGAYLLFALLIMLLTNVQLTLLILLLLLVSVFLFRFFEKHLVSLNRQVREINSRITGNFNEGITGMRTIKVLAVEKRMQKDFENETGNMYRTSIHTTHYSALFTASVTLLSSAALAVVLWRGGILTREGVIRIGTLSVFMSYALGMIDPLQTIISNISAFIGIQVNIERFTDLLAEVPEVHDSPEVIETYGDAFAPKKKNWEELYGDVEFDDVTFRYPDGEENVLSHFSLKVPQGTSVAIVGETGAGKSTLINLVCRFFEPTGGRILIDGRDARERSQLWLHSHIGYVLQTPHLFSGSVRENLRYGKPEATDEEIWEALRLVSADGIVRGMAKGLDTEVGEGGELLSTGEKQLLSFARALLADPRLLVLDEATSSIDTLTEKAIQDAIGVVTKGRTSFVVAHRLSTITNSDLILAVVDGRIVEQGTHRELMDKKGYYWQLYRSAFAKESLSGNV